MSYLQQQDKSEIVDGVKIRTFTHSNGNLYLSFCKFDSLFIFTPEQWIAVRDKADEILKIENRNEN